MNQVVVELRSMANWKNSKLEKVEKPFSNAACLGFPHLCRHRVSISVVFWLCVEKRLKTVPSRIISTR
jgi:hypothetical protein